MKIAIPVANGKLCAHFGHCEQFSIISVDPSTKQIISNETAAPPMHEPGILPSWLNEMGVDTIIAGGMGMRAQGYFAQFGIKALVGAPPETPERVVNAYLEGSLPLGENLCDH